MSNVTAAKPKVGGGIYRAPLGTALPTDTTTELNAAFKSLGYISEDGLSNGNSPSNESIKEWGGQTVLDVQNEKPDKYTFTMLESLNPEVLKTVYGNTNVAGTIEEGLSIKANNKELEEAAYVVDMIMSNNIKKRIVIPDAKVSSIGDVVHIGTDAVKYQVTISCYPDATGNTHYEYLKGASA